MNNWFFQVNLLISLASIAIHYFQYWYIQMSSDDSSLLQLEHDRLNFSSVSDETSSALLPLCSIMAPYAYMLKEMVNNKTSLSSKNFHLFRVADTIAATYYRENDIYLFLSDQLLSLFSRDEIKSILAHELGHAYFNHSFFYKIWMSFMRTSAVANFIYCVIFAPFVYADNQSPEKLILIIQSSLFFIALSLGLWSLMAQISQSQEFQADATSLKFHPNKESLISFFKTLSNLTMSDTDDLFDTHPSDADRITALEALKPGW